MTSKAKKREEIVRRYLTELGKTGSDPGLLDELFGADATIHGPGIELCGIETIRKFMRSLTNVAISARPSVTSSALGPSGGAAVPGGDLLDRWA